MSICSVSIAYTNYGMGSLMKWCCNDAANMKPFHINKWKNKSNSLVQKVINRAELLVMQDLQLTDIYLKGSYKSKVIHKEICSSVSKKNLETQSSSHLQSFKETWNDTSVEQTEQQKQIFNNSTLNVFFWLTVKGEQRRSSYLQVLNLDIPKSACPD